MTLNWVGMVCALATFGGVWIGHVGVRKIDSISPTIWLPTGVALTLGVLFEMGALVSESLYLSAALGILGITFLWDAVEFWRQDKRVRMGHAPANPGNRRHARLLAENETATTIDWLARDPLGRQLTREELQQIEREGR